MIFYNPYNPIYVITNTSLLLSPSPIPLPAVIARTARQHGTDHSATWAVQTTHTGEALALPTQARRVVVGAGGTGVLRWRQGAVRTVVACGDDEKKRDELGKLGRLGA